MHLVTDLWAPDAAEEDNGATEWGAEGPVHPEPEVRRPSGQTRATGRVLILPTWISHLMHIGEQAPQFLSRIGVLRFRTPKASFSTGEVRLDQHINNRLFLRVASLPTHGEGIPMWAPNNHDH